MGGCAEAERWVAEAEKCVSVRWMAEAERWVAVPRQRDGWRCRGREMGG
jgi:hypothetical protein